MVGCSHLSVGKLEPVQVEHSQDVHVDRVEHVRNHLVVPAPVQTDDLKDRQRITTLVAPHMCSGGGFFRGHWSWGRTGGPDGRATVQEITCRMWAVQFGDGRWGRETEQEGYSRVSWGKRHVEGEACWTMAQKCCRCRGRGIFPSRQTQQEC